MSGAWSHVECRTIQRFMVYGALRCSPSGGLDDDNVHLCFIWAAFCFLDLDTLPEFTSVSCMWIARSSFLYGVFRALNGRTEDANATIPMADIRSELSSVLLCYGVCCILTPFLLCTRTFDWDIHSLSHCLVRGLFVGCACQLPRMGRTMISHRWSPPASA